MLYPLKFKPIFKEKVWGGSKIKTVLHKDFGSLRNCGELWALSGVEGDESIVENGYLAGNTLNELVEVYMDELVGDDVYQRFGNEFPILIKFLNSQDFLSVQVHPDDTLAMQRHKCFGKNEMWYIIDAEDDSELIIGFKKGTDKETYLQQLNQGNIKDILNHLKVTKGDVFDIPAGRVHAIGTGILLAEIQQTSDITYRIYDWDRKDFEGKLRELHTDLATEAIDFSDNDSYYTAYARLENLSSDLIKNAYFSVNYFPISVEQQIDLRPRESFTAYVCVSGSLDVVYTGDTISLNMGETLLIPSELNDLTLIPKPHAVLLEAFI